MKRIPGRKVTELLILVLLTMTAGKAASIVVVDQQNSVASNDSQGGVVFGQSFTPTLPRIDAFEIVIGDTGTVGAQILDGVQGFDGLGGPVLGSSGLISVSTNGREPIQFDFPGGIGLTPGHIYVARVFSTSGIFAPGIGGITITTNNSYAGGQLFEAGFSDTLPFLTQYDSIFREGLTTPEPGTLWTIGLMLSVGAVFRVRTSVRE